MTRRKLKVGMSLWHVFAYPEESIELQEYVIRSIKKPPTKVYRGLINYKPIMVYTIQKNEFTWTILERKKIKDKYGRKTLRHGWAKNIDSCFYKNFPLSVYEEHGLPDDLAFTKSGAYKIAIDQAKRKLKKIKTDPHWLLDNGKPDYDYIKLYEKMISKLKGLYKKSKNRR